MKTHANTCFKEVNDMTTKAVGAVRSDTPVDKVEKLSRIVERISDSAMDRLEKFADAVLIAQQGEANGK
jgi:hypothetical protein